MKIFCPMSFARKMLMGLAIILVPLALIGNGCCSQSFYNCASNPLYCDSYSFQVHGGIAPIIWKKRGETDLLSCAANSNNPVLQLADHFPKFFTLYKLPWTVGAILGDAWNDNVELYAELNYLQGRQKHHSEGYEFVIPNVTPQQGLLVILSRYRLVDGYVGLRCYSDRYCDLVSLFLGVKIGFTSHIHVNSILSINGMVINILPAAGSAGCAPVPVGGVPE